MSNRFFPFLISYLCRYENVFRSILFSHQKRVLICLSANKHSSIVFLTFGIIKYIVRKKLNHCTPIFALFIRPISITLSARAIPIYPSIRTSVSSLSWRQSSAALSRSAQYNRFIPALPFVSLSNRARAQPFSPSCQRCPIFLLSFLLSGSRFMAWKKRQAVLTWRSASYLQF